MGIGFVIFIYAIFFGSITAAGTVFYLILHFSSKTNPGAAALKKDFVKLVLACAAIIGAAGSIFAAQTAMDLFIPSRVFSKSFGFSPTGDVACLRGYRFLLGEGGDARLEFYAESETVERIVRENDFTEEAKRPRQRSDDRTFVKMLAIPGVRVYRSSKVRNSDFGSDAAFLLYDPEAGHVYYSWVGID